MANPLAVGPQQKRSFFRSTRPDALLELDRQSRQSVLELRADQILSPTLLDKARSAAVLEPQL